MENIFENWDEQKGVLLEGLDPHMASTVNTLLENQKKVMMNENAAAGSTQTADIAGFRKILIPMIRRIIPGTIASELVGVQPMEGPVALVYSLRHRYAEAVDGTDVNGNDVSIAAGSEAFGNDHYAFPSSPIYDFYSGAILNDATTAGTEDGQPAGASGIGPGSPGDITGPQGPNGDRASGNAWGNHSNPASTLDGVGFPRGSGGGSALEGSGGRKMTMEIVSQAVEAGSRKLQAGWTIEAMQDMNAQHGLDIENEMTQALSAEIVQEIDTEIISDLVALAGTAATFNGAANSGAANGYAPAYVGDRLANLSVMINYVANEIGRKTRRGVGNYIVVSPMIVSVLQAASKSVFAPSTSGSFKGPNNTMLVGTLNGSIKVYSYLWNSVQSTDTTPAGTGDDTILVGYKGGNGETDSGYFYCPYIPLMSSGVVVNPLTFQPVVSLMTRYGKTTFVNNATSLGNSADYYGKITVSDLSFA
jgi:hypothetical protein